ncbi:hypothetical protein Y032_0549g3293 [Ancylostoma ceylanicum]|uniref:Uncharacterized protein n=1 Tax=Ancylostoma ceylanicum TaxID=53326 RepID=A0A016WQN3_9BILA|nr:hypothetical protein Y032_0549g3293 [Ancylostoma ceylanicum]
MGSLDIAFAILFDIRLSDTTQNKKTLDFIPAPMKTHSYTCLFGMREVVTEGMKHSPCMEHRLLRIFLESVSLISSKKIILCYPLGRTWQNSGLLAVEI